jgi:hypothetical protein
VVRAVYSGRRLRGLALKFFPVSAYRFGDIVDRVSSLALRFFFGATPAPTHLRAHVRGRFKFET